MAPRNWRRICKITVQDLAVETLRVGFTVTQSLAREPNKAELAIYNLAEASRNKLHKGGDIKVLVEAGYLESGLSTVFVGELREAFSRPEDENWVTIVRSGDGDKGARKSRKKAGTAGVRPGVSFDRVISDMAKKMGVGIGNLGAALKSGDLNPEHLGNVFAKGFNDGGLDYTSLQKLVRSSGHELSIQDGQFQALKRGAIVPGVKATFLSVNTGLEGSPEVDAKGVMSFRARILPGLDVGYPVEIESVTSYGSGIWRIEKRKVVGDTWEQDWSVEATCREIKG
jgi:hypothetical protein